MQKMVNEAVATAKGDIYKMDPVKLIAADGSEIILDRRAANVSGTIKNMLSGPGNFSEAQQGEVKFPEISAKTLEKVVQVTGCHCQRHRHLLHHHHHQLHLTCPIPLLQYFHYKLRYTNHAGQLPEFKIDAEQALELLMAANFLDT